MGDAIAQLIKIDRTTLPKGMRVTVTLLCAHNLWMKVYSKDDGGSIVLPSKQVVFLSILVLCDVFHGLALLAKLRHILPF